MSKIMRRQSLGDHVEVVSVVLTVQLREKLTQDMVMIGDGPQNCPPRNALIRMLPGWEQLIAQPGVSVDEATLVNSYIEVFDNDVEPENVSWIKGEGFIIGPPRNPKGSK